MSDKSVDALHSDRQADDLALVAALAALSFDSALAKREVDIEPVKQLATLLKASGPLEERTKKALAGLTATTRPDEGKNAQLRRADKRAAAMLFPTRPDPASDTSRLLAFPSVREYAADGSVGKS